MFFARKAVLHVFGIRASPAASRLRPIVGEWAGCICESNCREESTSDLSLLPEGTSSLTGRRAVVRSYVTSAGLPA